MANLSQLFYTKYNNRIKVRHNHTRAGEHYRKSDQQCLLCPSSLLIGRYPFIIPLLCAVKEKCSNHL